MRVAKGIDKEIVKFTNELIRKVWPTLSRFCRALSFCPKSQSHQVHPPRDT
jgi:hypothetical protein